MKKVFFLLVIFLTAQLTAQVTPRQEELKRFFNTKTLIVLENNPLNEYNYVIKEVLEKEWTVTDYEFINFNEFDEKRKDPQYSFLYMDIVSFENDKTDAQYKFLFVSLGGDYFRRNQMPDIVSVPISYANVDEESYIYKLGLLVRFMHNHIKLLKEQPDLVDDQLFKYYNNNMGDVKSKTVYLMEHELSKDINSVKRVKSYYPYPIRIVTKEEIAEAIEKRDDNVVFLHKVGPEGTKLNARCYKILMGANNANLYYFDFHKISGKNPDGMLSTDLKKMAKSKGN
ncbi:MAG: hypothetical protein ACOCUL_01010 [Bacteroidota bacterium]